MTISTLKKYLIIFAAFFSLCVPSLVSAVNLREELLFSVVQILTVDEKGDSFVGSGTTISAEGHVLTNHHVVTDSENEKPYDRILICYTISQTKLPRCATTARVIASNKDSDLALIIPDKLIGPTGETTTKSFQKEWRKKKNEFYAAPFKNTSAISLPSILDRITIWGYPSVGGSTVTVSSGFVSGFSLIEEGKNTKVKFIKTDTAINPGNSGGAAFDEYFSFIGIPSNAYPGQLGFLIPVQTVVEWLREVAREGLIDLSTVASMNAYTFSFKDIAEGDSLQSISALLRHLKIMKGYGDGTFRAEQALTNAEAVAILAAAVRNELPAVHSPSCPLSAHDKNTWYAKSLCYAHTQGWISLTSRYQPSALISEDTFASLYNKAFAARPLKSFSRSKVTRRMAAEYIFSLLAH